MGGKRNSSQKQPVNASSSADTPQADSNIKTVNGFIPSKWQKFFESFQKSWAAAKDVYYFTRIWKSSKQYKNIDDVLKPLLPLADMNLALVLLILSGVILTFFAFLTTYESAQLANFASDTFTQVTGMAQTKLTLDSIMPIAVFQFALYIPFNLILILGYEALAYWIFKITGGKGTFTQQLYMSSVVTLSLSLASVLSLLTPIACLQIVGAIALVILTLYISLYVNPKAYSIVHNISFNHSLAVALVLDIIKIFALALAMNTIAMAVGLPAPITIPSGA